MPLNEIDDRRKKARVLTPFFSGYEYTRIVMCPEGEIDAALAGTLADEVSLARGAFLPVAWGGPATQYVSDPILERATVAKQQGGAMREFELVYISVDVIGDPSSTYAEIALKRPSGHNDESYGVTVVGITLPASLQPTNPTTPVLGGPSVGDYLEDSPSYPFALQCSSVSVDSRTHAGRCFVNSVYASMAPRRL